MITPELQQYINQQRQQGLTDAQIRQNLASGGWSVEDLDQALGAGQSLSSNSFQMPAQVVTKPSSNYVVWIVATAVAISILGFGGYIFYKSQAVKNDFDNSKISQDSPYFPTNANDYNNMQGQKACGDWPAVDQSAVTLFRSSSSIPPELNDFPVYPGSSFVGTYGAGMLDGLVFCSNGSVKDIFDYYAAYGGNVWVAETNAKKNYIAPEQYDLIPHPSWSTNQQSLYLNKKDNSAELNVGIAESAGKSVIILVGLRKY